MITKASGAAGRRESDRRRYHAPRCDEAGTPRPRHGCPSALRAQDAGQRSPGPQQSPRLRLVPRRHHEIGQPAPAVRAPEPKLDQRHIAAAGIDQRQQVGIALAAARLAPDQHADIAGPQRRVRCRQAVMVVAHGQTFRQRGTAGKYSAKPGVPSRLASAQERQPGRGVVLFPVRLDDAVFATKEAWAAKLRANRHSGDFRAWKDGLALAFSASCRDRLWLRCARHRGRPQLLQVAHLRCLKVRFNLRL
jgi:hypothetical protein